MDYDEQALEYADMLAESDGRPYSPEDCEHADSAIIEVETLMDLTETGFCTDCEAPVERDQTQPEWHV
jgi:hypothetical protein